MRLMKKKGTILILTSILALMLLLVGCTNRNNELDNNASYELEQNGPVQEEVSDLENLQKPRMHLTFATLPAIETLPVFIAYSKGFFEDEGLTVVLEQFFNPRDRDIAFQTNDHIDGMSFDLVQLAIFRDAGVDIVATTSTVGLASVIGVAGIYNIEDLRGMDVLMTSNTAMDYILERALGSVGMTGDDVITNEVPALPTRLEMLLHGHAKGAVLPDPFATMALEEGLNTLTTTRELGINPFIYAFRGDVASENPEAMFAFYTAINRAVDFLNTADREDFIDVIIETVGYPEHIRDTLVVPYFPYHTVPTHEIVRDVHAFVFLRGLITTNISIDDMIFHITGK